VNFYSYKITRDYGFAPNPFFGFCSLATCKPKIRKAAEVNDWIIGTGAITNDMENRLIYLMQVNEKVTFEEYSAGVKYQRKKPILNGSLIQLHGDNIYFKTNDVWQQLDSHHSFHNGVRNDANLKTDTSGKYVLISYNFYYFGKNHIKIPDEFIEVCSKNRDYMKKEDSEVGKNFVDWISKNYTAGLLGDPIDWKDYQQKSLF